MNKTQKILVVSDVHSIFQDRSAVQAMMRVGNVFKPDQIIQIGDLLDCYSLSKYDKNPKRMASLTKEASSVRYLIDWMTSTTKQPVHYLWGNHENRIQKTMLHNLSALHEHYQSLLNEDILHLPSTWITHQYGDVYRIGKLGFTHGDIIRTDGGASALAQRRKLGGSIIMGHGHRLAQTYFTDSLGQYTAVECGHLSKSKHDYGLGPNNWQQGFCVAYVEPSGNFTVDLVPVRKGKAWWRGEWV